MRRLAGRVCSRGRGGDPEFADMVQLGMVGLLEAIDRYSPAHGVRFEAFAVRRIEGAMLNGLASYSERQSQLAMRRQLVAERAASLRGPMTGEQKSALERLADVAIGIALGFTLDGASASELAEPSAPDNAYIRTELAQLRRQLTELVKGLPDNERRVIFRHYFQRQSFDDIARGMEVTNGRVSQLHRSGLTKLREQLCKHRGLALK